MLSRLGDLISLNEEKNRDLNYGVSDVKGISINKVFIETKANLKGVSLRPYIIVKPKYFAYVTVTSRNGDKVSMAFNDTNETYIVSSSYVSFYVKNANILLPEYLYIYFNRPEFDRIARFNSWGSARETFSWDDLCDLKIHVPSIEIQQKYVNIYKSLVLNQHTYEYGLDDLKLTIDIFLESLKEKEKTKIGKFLEERALRNEELRYKFNSVVGVSKDKEIIKTKAKENNNDLSKYIIISKNDFVYNPRSANAIALNLKYNNALISWNNTAFYIKEEYLKVLSPRYLNLWFSRDEYSRWAIYNSWGSSTEILPLSDIFDYEIHIPERHVQDAIVKIFDLYYQKNNLNKKLKVTLKELSPILVKGATQESKGVI
ncbi:MAG TPA: restriction endonuclease subunit S [Acholeplasmataceae bacterium]|nr:restriction endonuclease subunit S [Acholeplasmataceae bacterium]